MDRKARLRAFERGMLGNRHECYLEIQQILHLCRGARDCLLSLNLLPSRYSIRADACHPLVTRSGQTPVTLSLLDPGRRLSPSRYSIRADACHPLVTRSGQTPVTLSLLDPGRRLSPSCCSKAQLIRADACHPLVTRSGQTPVTLSLLDPGRRLSPSRYSIRADACHPLVVARPS